MNRRKGMVDGKYQLVLIKYGERIPQTGLEFKKLDVAKETARYLNSLLPKNLHDHERYEVEEICQTEEENFDDYQFDNINNFR